MFCTTFSRIRRRTSISKLAAAFLSYAKRGGSLGQRDRERLSLGLDRIGSFALRERCRDHSSHSCSSTAHPHNQRCLAKAKLRLTNNQLINIVETPLRIACGQMGIQCKYVQSQWRQVQFSVMAHSAVFPRR